MKLQQFLKESNGIDFEHLEKFRDEIGDAILGMETALKNKGFKFEEVTSEPDDESYFGVVFTNKVLDIFIEVVMSPGKNPGDQDMDLVAQLSINDTYSIGEGKTLPTAIREFRVDDIHPHEEQKFIDGSKKIVEEILGLADAFHDWYLDVTGEYGKVKMYVDHKSKSDKPSIKALAGEFDINTKQHQVF